MGQLDGIEIKKQHDCVQDSEWENATKGFPGVGRNVCVVSMSGRCPRFWHGVKAECKELGIGFACVWEEQWGKRWWPQWQGNVREYGVEKGVSLVVLVDGELKDDQDPSKSETLL